MKIVPLNVIAALVAMCDRSQATLAKAAGLTQSTLSSGMRGHRLLPAAKLERLLRELKVAPDGSLDSHHVHLWVVGRRLDDLRVAAGHFFPQGVNFAGLWRAGSGPFGLARSLDLPIVALFDGSARVLVRSEGIGMFANPEPITRETVPALRQRIRGKGERPDMLEIPPRDFPRWERADISTKEFDKVIRESRQ
jgi:transcriptional regulator with XRE-family HTH domain